MSNRITALNHAVSMAIHALDHGVKVEKRDVVSSADEFAQFLDKADGSEVIKGFVVRLPGEKFAEYLDERAAHHQGKADAYKRNIEALRSQGETESTASNNPIYAQQQSLQTHSQRAGFFKFWSAYVAKDKTYELSDSDLSRFEIMESVVARLR